MWESSSSETFLSNEELRIPEGERFEEKRKGWAQVETGWVGGKVGGSRDGTA